MARAWRDGNVTLETSSVTVGKVTSDELGTTTATPTEAAPAVTAVEDGTARTGISLWKRMVNLLVAMIAKLPSFGTAGAGSANVLTIQGAGGGTAVPISGSVTTSGTATVSGSVTVSGSLTSAGTVTEASGATIATNTGILAGSPAVKALTRLTVPIVGAAATRLAADDTFARKVCLTARKATGANAGVIYLGTSAVDAGTAQMIDLQPGDYWEFEAPPGTKFDLYELAIDGATDDGVQGFYIPA